MTNGSLTRDKRPCHNSPFGSPKSPSRIQPHFAFDSSKENKLIIYENMNVQNLKMVHQNGDVPNNNRTTSNFVHEEKEEKHSSCDLQPTTKNNSQSAKWPISTDNREAEFSNSISHVRNPNYENIAIENGTNNVTESPVVHEKAKSESPSIFGKIYIFKCFFLQFGLYDVHKYMSQDLKE